MKNNVLSLNNIGKLSKEELEEILLELEMVKKEYCTVRIEIETEGEAYFYGIFEMSTEELNNYYDSGGVWDYDTPRRYIEIIEEYFEYMKTSDEMLEMAESGNWDHLLEEDSINDTVPME